MFEVGWEGVEAAVEALCYQVTNPERIDLVVGISRGGIVPARLVAEHLGVKSIEVLQKSDSVNEVFFKLNGYLNILFVDDINDSGKTFNALEQLMAHISIRGQYRMGALYKRHTSKNHNSLYGIKIEDDNWLWFPWENDSEK